MLMKFSLILLKAEQTNPTHTHQLYVKVIAHTRVLRLQDICSESDSLDSLLLTSMVFIYNCIRYYHFVLWSQCHYYNAHLHWTRDQSWTFTLHFVKLMFVERVFRWYSSCVAQTHTHDYTLTVQTHNIAMRCCNTLHHSCTNLCLIMSLFWGTWRRRKSWYSTFWLVTVRK